MKLQLKELAANEMLKTMLPSLNVLARISLLQLPQWNEAFLK